MRQRSYIHLRLYGGSRLRPPARRQGPIYATAQILRRAWQLYIAHIFLFVIFIAEVSYTVATFNNPMYNDEMRVGDFLEEPHVAIVKALLLQFQPTFLDILPLYIVLLVAFPLDPARAAAGGGDRAGAVLSALRLRADHRFLGAGLSRRPCLVLQSPRLAISVYRRGALARQQRARPTPAVAARSSASGRGGRRGGLCRSRSVGPSMAFGTPSPDCC